jgi:hypothetical protein
MISVEKPGSPSEILEHHGVKGQKWGVRQRSQLAGTRAGKSAAKEARKSGSGRVEQRRVARKASTAAAKTTSANLRGTSANLAASRKFATKFPTGKTRATEIQRARYAQVARAAKFHASPKGSPQREAAKKAFLNHPDRATALRMTRGEKVVFSILGVATAPVGFGVGIGIGSGIRVGARRKIERKQASGAYR